MTVTKLHGEFIFPIVKHNWPQPHDGHKMTRRMRVGRDLTIEPATNESEVNNSRKDSEVNHSHKKKRRKLTEKDRKEYCDFDDMMPESEDESDKFLPDRWTLTSAVLIRIHNKPRRDYSCQTRIQKIPVRSHLSTSTSCGEQTPVAAH